MRSDLASNDKEARADDHFNRMVTKLEAGDTYSFSKEGRRGKKRKKATHSNEWAHLLPHNMLGSVSQVPENLSVATKFSNTLMMFLENRFSEMLYNMRLNSFNLEVSVELFARTHIAKNIFYAISAKGLQMNFQIPGLAVFTDGKSNFLPHIVIEYYTKILFESVISTSQSFCRG